MIGQLLAYNTLVVLAGVSLLGASAGLIGSFAVLRKQSLISDAVAHAALPGVCLAFLMAGERHLPLMLLGALLSGVAGMLLIAALSRWTRVKEDSSIGIVLSVFPGLGFALLRYIQNEFPSGGQAGLESFIFGKTAGMTRGDVYLILAASLVCLAAVLLFYKEFKVISFDRGFAQALGWPVFLLDVALMSLIAVAVVIGLPAVGAVMMAALLILPAAAARFWTDRLGRLLWLSTLFGVTTGLVGTLLSARFDKLPAGPIIVLAGSAIFLVSMLLGSRRGILARWLAHLRNQRELGRQLTGSTPGLSPVAGNEYFDPLAAGEGKGELSRARQSRLRSGLQKEATRHSPPTRSSAWPLALGYTLLAVIAAGIWLWQLDSARASRGEPPQLTRDLGTIGIGVLCNAACAILGCYLVLRRMSLLADAISHSVLPGLAIAFLLTGSTYGLPMILGAMALGILTSVLTQSLHSLGKVPEDASLGIVFTTLFAVGVIMIQHWAWRAHIDADCVLYGQLEYAWSIREVVFGLEVPRVLISLAPALVGVVLFVVLLWKELKIVSFDPQLASAMGIRAWLVHYALMAMVAGVTVSAFEAVGSILVVAMIVVPAATAALLTQRLATMILWSVLIGTTSAAFGYLAAASFNTNVAGMTAVMAGVQFGGTVLLAPRQGLVSKWLRTWSLAVRIAAEDVIGRLFRAEELSGAPQESLEPLRSGLLGWLARWQLLRRGYVQTTTSGLQLTDAGRGAARRLVRAHRLWESYLETHFELPSDHLHEPAHRMEHFIDERLQDEINLELDGRTVDPHGKEIPAVK